MGKLISKLTLGFIPARRGFFSAELATTMRRQTIAAMKAQGIEVVAPTERQTKLGCVENAAEAAVCGDLFRAKGVAGIVVSALNFGDEQSVAAAVRRADLNVPVLIVGCQEEETLTPRTARRDSFCGLLSIGEALRQIGARYSVARTPIGFPADESFAADIRWFAGVCRVVNGLRRARYGQLGARPDAFWTCRYDEKALQLLGPTAVTLDLSEAFAALARIPDSDRRVKAVVGQIKASADTSQVADAALVKMAKLELFLSRWRHANNLDALAVQCWTSLEQNYGVCACAVMGRLGDRGLPCACEVDVLGAMSMHACLLAGGTPAGLADWNNLHNDDPELVNLWHCGVFPPSLARDRVRLGTQWVIASSGAARAEDSQGVAEFVARPGPVTLARITQDGGQWKALVEQGSIEDNPAATFGAYGWCRIPRLGRLYRDVLLRHFPHHVAVTPGHVGDVLWEAFGNYLGLAVFHGAQDAPGVYTPRSPFVPSA